MNIENQLKLSQLETNLEIAVTTNQVSEEFAAKLRLVLSKGHELEMMR